MLIEIETLAVVDSEDREFTTSCGATLYHLILAIDT
jgi:hypothetical protein